ncbi:NUDIX hydrolase domain-like protein [Nemania sp. FL0916]|nr:NUDIX hydrolase domain-like protein [Nemania sp. FL0916]
MAPPPPATSARTNAATAIAPSATRPPQSFTWDPSVVEFILPLTDYLKTNSSIQGVCVGAFVFDDRGRLLVVQRAPHDSYPLRWEVPGGTIDKEDESILHGLVRELWEETGLRTRHVPEKVGRGYTFLTRRPACVCKYSFVVDVYAYDVKLDPNEHVAFLWITEDEAKMKKCGGTDLVYTSAAQEQAILQSFHIPSRQRTEI